MGSFIPSTFLFHQLIRLHFQNGLLREAHKLFDEMPQRNVYSWNALILAYVKAQDLTRARALFDSATERDLVIYNSILTGYVTIEGRESDALERFDEMQLIHDRLKFDEFTLLAMLNLVAKLHVERYGTRLHAYMVRTGNGKIFHKLTGRDLILYNIMISGYANHGHEDQAMELYKEMLERGLKPDEVTFIALLSACRHSGLVEMGEKYFKSMVEDYKIVPKTDHYACVIDLYGRANRLEKAMHLMKKIPRNSDPLANVFAAEENWAEMRKIREKMRGKETKKLAGCSWVYLENGIHAFTSGDTSHSKAIYSILEFLSADLRVPPNSSVHYVLGGVARNIANCMSKLGRKPFSISAVGLDTAAIPRQVSFTPKILQLLWSAVYLIQMVRWQLVLQALSQLYEISSASVVMVDANLNDCALEAFVNVTLKIRPGLIFPSGLIK
ncbi:putative pentatricopeptide repeat-containing protein At3g18840 [Eucalyptus grandis]|uniref:putative pentatricopeptide repeat-containing protein At3g18840 n=1 Tax=Eucalyptus grandis TaxID=71139 RepID=UPI00192E79FB|nr:putative pentatricopeptide repeat-containing protein At3g18840 [Eucalyptus grandis]